MKQKISYTLMLDWHAAGIITVLMAFAFLSATFPQGRWVYLMLTHSSGPKIIFAIAGIYFFAKASLRTWVALAWLLCLPARNNALLGRLACAPCAARKSDAEIAGGKKSAWVQYLLMICFLSEAALAMFLSVPAALGATALQWVTSAIWLFGAVTVTAAFVWQYRARLGKNKK